MGTMRQDDSLLPSEHSQEALVLAHDAVRDVVLQC